MLSEAITQLSVHCESEFLESTSASQTQDDNASATKKPTKAQRRKVTKAHSFPRIVT